MSDVLSKTIFSPGLKAGIPIYGQLAQRNASPRQHFTGKNGERELISLNQFIRLSREKKLTFPQDDFVWLAATLALASLSSSSASPQVQLAHAFRFLVVPQTFSDSGSGRCLSSSSSKSSVLIISSSASSVRDQTFLSLELAADRFNFTLDPGAQFGFRATIKSLSSVTETYPLSFNEEMRLAVEQSSDPDLRIINRPSGLSLLRINSWVASGIFCVPAPSRTTFHSIASKSS